MKKYWNQLLNSSLSVGAGFIAARVVVSFLFGDSETGDPEISQSPSIYEEDDEDSNVVAMGGR